MKFEEPYIVSVQVAEAEQIVPPVTFEERKGTNPDLNALLAALEHERIAALAFSFWQQRGCPEGSPEEDWFRAEREIREEA